MLILTSGFYFPNGKFKPNEDGGHERNAYWYLQKYPQLLELAAKYHVEVGNSDDILISAGCIAVGNIRGQHELRIAVDNTNPIINNLVELYEAEGIKVIKGWKLYPELVANVLSKVIQEDFIEDGSTAINLEWAVAEMEKFVSQLKS